MHESELSATSTLSKDAKTIIKQRIMVIGALYSNYVSISEL